MQGRKKTKIRFYYNTPFTDFNNYIDFGSNEARDKFFSTHYNHTDIFADFNMVRDRLTLRVPTNDVTFKWASQSNYMSFINDFDDILYYAQVVETLYINNNVTEFHFVIDGLMTFCQGDIAPYIKNVQVEREHLPTIAFNQNLKYLRTNTDGLEFNNLEYVHQDNFNMTDLKVVFRSSVDLTANFGGMNDPKVNTASGITFDKIVSPQNLYTCDYNQYSILMKKLEKYPWITQNITSVILVPSKMIDNSQYHKVTMKSIKFNDLYEFNNNGKSTDLGNIVDLNHDMTDLREMFNIPANHPEMLRAGYTNIELTNWQGQDISLDPAYLKDDLGLQIFGELILGYTNELYFYPKGYKNHGENLLPQLPNGTYLNNAIIFKQFDSAPLLTDNYRLSVASTANQRALAENNTVTGLAGNVVNPKTNLQDRFMSAVSLMSNASLNSLGGRLTDEWQFYRKQNAEIADKKIQAPSISEMTENNSFSIKQGFFGLTVKYSRIDDESIKAVENYHSNFGFSIHRTADLHSTESMTYLNYVKFSGNWILHDRKVPQSIMEQIRTQFENGVRIWHNPDNLDNPYKQDISIKNERKL